jgi:hypothetical protein
VASDRVAAAVAELYGADPDAFTERRKALAVAAREVGDKQSATAITALRKPTRAAWAVNQLARADPDAPTRLAAMAAELRDAERAKDGPRLRELSAARGALIDALTAQALAATGTADPPPSLRAEVTDTLTAALSDPETAAAFAAGALTKAAQWSGFGYADLGPADEAAPDGTRSADAFVPAPVDIATQRSRRARTATNSAGASRGSPRNAPDGESAPSHQTATPSLTRAPRRTDAAKHDRTDANPSAEVPVQRAAREQARPAAEERRWAAEEQRRAQEAAERAARAREKYQDAERTLAQASTAATEAATVEDRLEAEVRQLEGRLTQAREELATARLRARRAEAAERRARQVLERIPHP